MRSARFLVLFILGISLGSFQGLACEVDPLSGLLDPINPIRPLSELYASCASPTTEEMLCNCEPIVSDVQKAEADASVKAESEKAWLDAFQGEIWGLGQSLINFDSASRLAGKSSSKDLAPSCNVSSIFKKIASFAETEGCDASVFKSRVKAIFKTESLSEAQESIVKQVTSISQNEAPSSIEGSENICIPYTTYNYMKNGSSTFDKAEKRDGLLKSKQDIDKKCNALVSDKIQPYFCSKDLPSVKFENFQRIIQPSLERAEGAPKATSIAYKHYCSEESSDTEVLTDSSVSDDLKETINLDEREVTDFEKFNRGIKTEYQKFNENVCSLLPKCTQDETKGECRNVISLRAMLIDNLKNKIGSNVSKELLKEFSRSPENIDYDEEKFKNLSKEEFNSSTELLSYLNQFIINKADKLKNADGSGFINNKLTNDSKNKKLIPSNSVNKKLIPNSKEVEKEKSEKLDLLFAKLEKRGEASLTFGSKDLDQIEDTKLLKSFVGGEIVKDPSLSKSDTTSRRASSSSSPSSSNQESMGSSQSPQEQKDTSSEVNRNIARRFERAEDNKATSLPSRNRVSDQRRNLYKRTPSSKPTKSSKVASSSRAKSSSTQSAPKSFAPSNEKSQFPSRKSVPGNSNPDSSFERYKQAYSNYSSKAAGSKSSSLSDEAEESAPDSNTTSEQFKNINTGKKGKGTKGASKKSIGSNGAGPEKGEGQPLLLGKDGKPLKGKFKVPAYVFGKIIPQVIIEKIGLSEVILRYGLVGKRFNVLEIDQEDNFILHTYDFSTDGLAFEEGFNNNQYNIVRIDILKQVQEIIKEDQDAKETLKMLATKTKKVKTEKVKYEITKEEIIAKTISPLEVQFAIASNI